MIGKDLVAAKERGAGNLPALLSCWRTSHLRLAPIHSCGVSLFVAISRKWPLDFNSDITLSTPTCPRAATSRPPKCWMVTSGEGDTSPWV